MEDSSTARAHPPPARKMRIALIATALGLMAVVAVIVSSEPIDFSGRGDGRTVVLAQQDPFDQEMAAAQHRPQQASAMSQEKEKKAGAAARLLEKARSELKARGGAIDTLVTAAKVEDAAAAKKETEAKRRAARFLAAAAASAPPKGTLHMVSGWGQRGGAMPTTFQAPEEVFPYDDASAPERGEEGGDYDYEDSETPAIGIVDGGSGRSYVGSDAAAQGGGGGGGDLAAPFRWFLQGFATATATANNGPIVHVYQPAGAQGGGGAGEEEAGGVGGNEEEEGYDDEEEGYGDEDRYSDPPPSASSSSSSSSSSSTNTPEVERVEEILRVKKEEEELREQEGQLEQGVYEDASNGRLADMQGSEGARAFATGFLKGAVEGSKKSVEAQGKLAEQLSRQAALVDELEHIVRALEDVRRKDNFDKTAGALAPPTSAPAPPPAAPAQTPSPAVVPPFKIDFYMESECPGCKSFTTSALTDTLNALADHIELRAIPYGNAQLNGTLIRCQHGKAECDGNKVMLCMMKQYPDWKTWFPAFKCVESSDKPPLNVTRHCLSAQGMDVDAVLACANAEEGELLHLKAAKETISLDPPHKFTPWVVVDGEPVGDKVMDLLSQLCNKLPHATSGAIAACHPQFKAPLSAATSQLLRSPQFCYP